MPNEFQGLYSIHSKQYLHVNHGWWCSECTNHLFELDQQVDHTAEWLEVIGKWSLLLGTGMLEVLVAVASSVVMLVVGICWIALCFFEGVDSDTREYEKQLTAKDGLGREARDGLNGKYNVVLANRQQHLKDIDTHKANMELCLTEKDYRDEQRAMRECQYAMDLANAQLKGFERDLNIPMGV